MIVDCISDLHGHYPTLEGGDLLIVAGDLTAHQTVDDYLLLGNWIVENSSQYEEIIFISGNHDTRCESQPFAHHHIGNVVPNCYYLCDSGTEFQGLKIWGSPWTKTFDGMNPHCMAFTLDTEEQLAEKWEMIPEDIDILITHSPAYRMQDYRPLTKEEKIANFSYGFGSKSLAKRIHKIDDEGDGKQRIMVCGHIHEGCGILNISNFIHDKCTWKVINSSHVNERYEPVNPPVRVIL